MKIAIPVEEQNIETTVCPSFGRAPFLALYDTENNETVFIKNDAAGNQGGAGIKTAQTIVDNGVSVLIVPRCGENAANVLYAAGVNLYKSVNGTVKDNITAFSCNNLEELTEIHKGFHNFSVNNEGKS